MKAGLPETAAAMLADSDSGVSRGALFDGGLYMSKHINRPTTSLAASVAMVMMAGAQLESSDFRVAPHKSFEGRLRSGFGCPMTLDSLEAP